MTFSSFLPYTELLTDLVRFLYSIYACVRIFAYKFFWQMYSWEFGSHSTHLSDWKSMNKQRFLLAAQTVNLPAAIRL